MSNNLFQAPAILQDKGKLQDNTRKLVLLLPEIDPDDEADIIKNHGKEGWFIFSPTKIKDEDVEVPDYKPMFKGDKTPGQRLRAVLFIFWEQQHQGTKSSDEFYKETMENIINSYKEKLN